mmetsp:Transcript_4158/g.14588  ORF Transcript_4158/g.14588 Transcript_4158/m.14588 type:complete len:227 (+) Transcript_4158:1108-1788(+)
MIQRRGLEPSRDGRERARGHLVSHPARVQMFQLRAVLRERGVRLVRQRRAPAQVERVHLRPLTGRAEPADDGVARPTPPVGQVHDSPHAFGPLAQDVAERAARARELGDERDRAGSMSGPSRVVRDVRGELRRHREDAQQDVSREGARGLLREAQARSRHRARVRALRVRALSLQLLPPRRERLLLLLPVHRRVFDAIRWCQLYSLLQSRPPPHADGFTLRFQNGT